MRQARQRKILRNRKQGLWKLAGERTGNTQIAGGSCLALEGRVRGREP